MSFSKFSLVTIGVSAIALGACSMGHPNALPTGYTYHHDVYKSPTPAPSPRVSTAQRESMTIAQAEQFRNAVYDLVTRLSERAGMPPKPVFVLPPKNMTAFYAHIDNDLRESMRTIGYAISDRPEGAYVFTYSADLIDSMRGTEQTGQPNVELILRVFNEADPKARQLTQEVGRYFIQGAEAFDIYPTVYADLPTYQTIRHQMQGFDAFEAPRTTSGDLNTSLNETNRMMPVMAAPKVQEPMPDPLYTTEPVSPVSVDSGMISYEEPMVEEYQASMPRPRISREMDY
jgi:hypothetical protein